MDSRVSNLFINFRGDMPKLSLNNIGQILGRDVQHFCIVFYFSCIQEIFFSQVQELVAELYASCSIVVF